MAAPTLAEPAAATLVIRPGDHVLVALRDVVARDHAERLKGMLRARFPEVEFSVITGVQALAVMPKDSHQ